MVLGLTSSNLLVHVLILGVVPSFANRFAARLTQTRMSANGSGRRGLDGSGEIVGIADTGIDLRHAFFHDPLHEVPVCGVEDARSDLSSCVNFQHRKIVSYRLVKPGLPAGTTLMVHGTHIAGTLAGSATEASSEYNGHSVGSKLVFDDILAEGDLSMSVPPDMQTNLFPHSYAVGARIYSNSWGTVRPAYTHQSRQVDQFIWDHQDFVVLFASMNFGPSSYSVASPGTAKNAICVGSSTNVFEGGDDDEPAEHMIAVLTIEDGPSGTLANGTEFHIMCQAQTFVDEGTWIGGRLLSLSASDVCSKHHPTCKGCIWLVQEGAGCSALTLAVRAEQEGALAVLISPSTATDGPLSSRMTWKSPLPTFTVEPATAKLLSSLQDASATPATHPRITIQRAPPSPKHEPWRRSRLSWFSSRGPTFPDGRFKPDVLCPGENIASSGPSERPSSESSDAPFYRIVTLSGTSMATPACAGAAAIVRQFLREGWFRDGTRNTSAGIQPVASLVKAMLIHSARQVRVQPDDNLRGKPRVLPPGWTAGLAPSSPQGFGLVGLDAVLDSDPRLSSSLHIVNGELIGPTQQYRLVFTVNQNSSKMLRATLTWTDPPAPHFVAVALVNDLDLLVHTPDGTTLLGNGLALHGGTERVDTVNNVEQVSVASPAAGDYIVVVAGVWINRGPQAFSLVVTGDGHVQSEEGPGLLADMLCKNDCGGRGQCRGGSCRCESGYFGAGCEVEVRCGDGEVEPGLEDCDDGNTEDRDGCSSQCSVEAGFDCPRRPDQTSRGSDVAGAALATGSGGEKTGKGCVVCGCSGGCTLLDGGHGSFGANLSTINPSANASRECYWIVAAEFLGYMVYRTNTQISLRFSSDLTARTSTSLTVAWCADQHCRQWETMGEVQDGGGGFRAWSGWVRVGFRLLQPLNNQPAFSGSWSAVGVLCGDFFMEGEEGCDDGNTESGDGCSSGCKVEDGFCCWPRGEASRWTAAGSICERAEESLCGAPCVLEPLCADIGQSSAASEVIGDAGSGRGGMGHGKLLLAACCLVALLHAAAVW